MIQPDFQSCKVIAHRSMEVCCGMRASVHAGRARKAWRKVHALAAGADFLKMSDSERRWRRSTARSTPAPTTASPPKLAAGWMFFSCSERRNWTSSARIAAIDVDGDTDTVVEFARKMRLSLPMLVSLREGRKRLRCGCLPSD
jgi:hypothetical protein